MAARNRVFAIADDPSVLFEKSVLWFLPSRFVSPRLWDYSRQVYEFATGLERQGNRLFCSSDEVVYWENKAYMHRRLAECGAPMPRTQILTTESWFAAKFDIEPVLIKEEHAAGSSGVHHFARTTEARAFVQNYAFRPTESLLMQEVVPGATRDMRLTIVGDTIIRSASFWRIKSAEALASPQWRTTATRYGSRVDHGNIPESAVPLAVKCLRDLGIRMAGIDMIWIDDDVSRTPLILEISPYYQPNPPKPARYEHWSYKRYKQKPFIKEGYFSQQYMVFREIAGQVLDQGLF
jgi:glutathione synthase/RimK-type ligase-like ATP-grasp enzyme